MKGCPLLGGAICPRVVSRVVNPQRLPGGEELDEGRLLGGDLLERLLVQDLPTSTTQMRDPGRFVPGRGVRAGLYLLEVDATV